MILAGPDRVLAAAYEALYYIGDMPTVDILIAQERGGAYIVFSKTERKVLSAKAIKWSSCKQGI